MVGETSQTAPNGDVDHEASRIGRLCPSVAVDDVGISLKEAAALSLDIIGLYV